MNHAQSAKFETKVRFRKRSFTSWKKNAQSVNTIHLYSNNNYNLSSSSSAIYPICILSRPLCFITQRILHRSLRAGPHDACFLPKDLRQVGKRFAGGLALDPSLARGAQGLTGNGPAEALIITSLQDKTHDQTNDGRKVAEKFLYKS